jgi:hypothetical protein
MIFHILVCGAIFLIMLALWFLFYFVYYEGKTKGFRECNDLWAEHSEKQEKDMRKIAGELNKWYDDILAAGAKPRNKDKKNN